jgi:methyl-branched lipid omega-hydroxylase
LVPASKLTAADDLTTSLVQAEVDGERLASAEVASFFIAASEESTRLASSFVHGIKRLPVVWTVA